MSTSARAKRTRRNKYDRLRKLEAAEASRQSRAMSDTIDQSSPNVLSSQLETNLLRERAADEALEAIREELRIVSAQNFALTMEKEQMVKDRESANVNASDNLAALEAHVHEWDLLKAKRKELKEARSLCISLELEAAMEHKKLRMAAGLSPLAVVDNFSSVVSTSTPDIETTFSLTTSDDIHIRLQRLEKSCESWESKASNHFPTSLEEYSLDFYGSLSKSVCDNKIFVVPGEGVTVTNIDGVAFRNAFLKADNGIYDSVRESLLVNRLVGSVRREKFTKHKGCVLDAGSVTRYVNLASKFALDPHIAGQGFESLSGIGDLEGWQFMNTLGEDRYPVIELFFKGLFSSKSLFAMASGDKPTLNVFSVVGALFHIYFRSPFACNLGMTLTGL